MANVVFQKNGVDVVDMLITAADFDSNGLWHSDAVASTNDSRVTASATYAELTPDGQSVNVDYRLQAVLEGETSTGVWEPLVRQLNSTFRGDNAPTHRLIATTGPLNYIPGEAHIIPDALGQEVIQVSVEDVDIPGRVRMCISLGDRDQGFAALTSFKLTLRGSLV